MQSLHDFVREQFKDRKPNVQKLYRETVNRFEHALGRQAGVHDLTAERVGQMIAWMEARNRSHTSIVNQKDRLGLFARLAADQQLVPSIGRLAYDRRGWTREELARLLLSARHQPGRGGPIEACRFWPAMLLCCVDTAIGPAKR